MTDSVRQPDLTVYFTPLDNTYLNITTLNGTELIDVTRPVYIDYELKSSIGAINLVTRSNTLTLLKTFTIVLPFGSLVIQQSGNPNAYLPKVQSTKLNGQQFSAQQLSNSSTIFTIISGNGDFLGSKGYVTITTDDTLTRRVDFWLDKQ